MVWCKIKPSKMSKKVAFTSELIDAIVYNMFLSILYDVLNLFFRPYSMFNCTTIIS